MAKHTLSYADTYNSVKKKAGYLAIPASKVKNKF